MSTPENNDRPRRVDAWYSERPRAEEVLVDEATGTVIHLNASAALVWRLCDGARSIDEVCELLTEAYPEAPDRVRREVIETLAGLDAAGAIVIHPDAG